MTDLRDQLQGTLGTAYTLERELGVGGMAHDSWPRRWKTWRATLPLPGRGREAAAPIENRAAASTKVQYPALSNDATTVPGCVDNSKVTPDDARRPM
jgi:hypothetical protein